MNRTTYRAIEASFDQAIPIVLRRAVIGGKRHADDLVLMTLSPFAPMGRLNIDVLLI